MMMVIHFELSFRSISFLSYTIAKSCNLVKASTTRYYE